MPDIKQIEEDLEKQKKQIQENLLTLKTGDPQTELPESMDLASLSFLADAYLKKIPPLLEVVF